MTTVEKNFAKELDELLSDNSNYKSSYTGTPMFFSEIAIPKIIALMKAKGFSFNALLCDSSPQICDGCGELKQGCMCYVNSRDKFKSDLR